MPDAPRQDWAAYDAAVRPHELQRLRRMTPAEKFALYEDMFELVTAGRIGTEEWKRLEELRWQEKLRIRNKMVDAFRKLDVLYALRLREGTLDMSDAQLVARAKRAVECLKRYPRRQSDELP